MVKYSEVEFTAFFSNTPDKYDFNERAIDDKER